MISAWSGDRAAAADGGAPPTQPAQPSQPAPSSLPPPPTVNVAPPIGARFLPGQRFDIRIEGLPPNGRTTFKVSLDGKPLAAAGDRNALIPHGEGALAHLDFTARDVSMPQPGAHHLVATWGSGSATERRDREIVIEALARLPAGHGARNVILFLGDGMGVAHRTGARVLAHAYERGRPRSPLAMDTMEATGLVMTSSLNALITDSAPGMAAYTSGNKANNNQMGVFPDDTPEDAFDNPGVEYLGAWLYRSRGAGFHMGIVTTADVTDATPAACAVHTANRRASEAIARAFFDDRANSGLSVLIGGGRKRFQLKSDKGEQADRDVAGEFRKSGFTWAEDADGLDRAARDKSVTALLGLLHPENMTTAFDKMGAAGGYSDELRDPKNLALRKQPMLKDMTRAALNVLQRTSPRGFLLVVEGASIDKRSHDQDAERALWDVIELDQAVAVALEYARSTNGNADPGDDTLVVVTADHETGGLSLAAVGNERYQPAVLGKAVRDYAATLRNDARQVLPLFPNYDLGPDGFPRDPDPSRKLIVGWGAGGDRYENFTSNRRERTATRVDKKGVAGANPNRDAPSATDDNDNRSVGGRSVPGFLVPGIIETGADRDPNAPDDTSSVGSSNANHTATDVPLSASGPGALLFTGTYDNTDVFFKIARVLSAWGARRTADRGPQKVR